VIKTVIGSLTLFALGWIAWPYYAVYDFANAIQRGDQVALEHRVAWDEVRRGLRDDFNALFLQRLGKNEGAGSALGTGLAVLLGPTIISNAIDNYVTPGGIAAAIRSGKISIPSTAQIGSSSVNQGPANTLDKQQDRLHWEQVKYAFFSGGPLTFRVEIVPDNAETWQRPVTLLFKWAGDWKLSRIFFPLDATQDAPARQETTEEIQSRRDVEVRAANDLRKDLSAGEVSALRARLTRLWTIPAGAKNPEELIVRIRFALNRERRIVGTPTVLTEGSSALFKASRESALQAVMAAQPFTMLFPEHYEAWKEIEMTFDPRQR
jgi:hypothetical protein